MRLVIYLSCCFITCAFNVLYGETTWPTWRGTYATGVSKQAKPPTCWSETKNIRWKIPLSGKGHSTPVVWGDYIFLTLAQGFGETAQPERANAPGAHGNLMEVQKQRFVVVAISRQNGEVLWETICFQDMPREGGYASASFASQSPVTDGKNVYASFGSNGIYCLDFTGKIIWFKDLGQMHTKHAHGEGSSLALYKKVLFINWDHEGASFLVALDVKTGTEKWKVPRDEKTSWASPIVITHNGQPQLIVSATTRIRSYEPGTGKLIWACGGLSDNVVASPVYGSGILICGSSYNIKSMVAIDLDLAKGDITGTDAVIWQRKQQTPYVPSPLLYDDTIYFLRHYQGYLSQVDIKTGKTIGGPYKLGGLGNIYSSPVGAANKIYVTGTNGTTVVLSHEKSCKTLATNTLDDSFSASAVAVEETLILRGEHSIYCIAKK